jgi:hypothetical protein
MAMRATKGSESLCEADSACTPKIRFLRFLGLKLDPNSKIDARNAMQARSKPTEGAIYL